MTKRTTSTMRCLVILLLCLVVLPGGVAAQEGRVDLFGYYFLEGQAPRAFADISEMHLSTINERGAEVPLWGFIRLKALRRARPVDFRLVRPMRNGRKFTFSTKAVGDISYQFAGEFLKLGDLPVTRPDEEVVLKGRLTKLRKGKPVANSDVRFLYRGGD